ncbi:helix-turn-helix transcriptional regulator [Micromonospora sp. NPDC048935]|uniref:helix-turn-helix transcriptional regulator n=1 Tax=Micromonospora sp. NPDC048935 TaxID=3364262 RepID=UPI003718F79D
MQKAIERAISTMWDRYDEPLSLDAMAHSAYLSRFYFSRLFRSMTGTSPGRFLTAIRLYQAKIRLRETDMSVTDIAYGVGYNSLGTFISRFTRSVGVSPARYRALAEAGMPRLSESDTGYGRPGGSIRGRIVLPPLDMPVRVYVGAFPDPIVQGHPLACDIVESSGQYVLADVPAGEWFLRAAAIGLPPAGGCAEQTLPVTPRPLAVGTYDNVKVTRGEKVTAHLELHRSCIFDLPILMALPELDSRAAGGPPRGRRPYARVAE